MGKKGQGKGMKPGDSNGEPGKFGAQRTGSGKGNFNGQSGRLNPRRFKDGNWARFRGRLENDSLVDESADTPEEYRNLIHRYFREVARQGKQDQDEKK